MSSSQVLPATVTMGVTPLILKPGAAHSVSEVLPARVSMGAQTITPGAV